MRRIAAEFREFISRGNLVEIAVAFVMGAAFTGVVNALTGRVVSPLIGMITDVSALEGVWTFGSVDPATGVPQGSVGAFLAAVINFLIVAAVTFAVVRAYNALRGPEQSGEPAPLPEDVALLAEIRDLLRQGRP